MDTRAFKRSLHHSDRYNRRGFGLGDEVAGSLEQAYQSNLVASLRENGHELQRGRLTVLLAEAFGFCWGVERAVAEPTHEVGYLRLDFLIRWWG